MDNTPLWMGMYGLKYDMFATINECIYILILQEYTGYFIMICIVNCGNMDNSQVFIKTYLSFWQIIFKDKMIENILYLVTHIKISKMMHDMR